MFDFKNSEDFLEKCGYIIDGVWYPRVTKIVEIKSKPALYRYYGDSPSYAAAQAMTEQSAKEGTMVHEAVEAIMVGQEPEVDPLIAPAVNAFRQFFETNNVQIEPAHVEKRIWNPEHRYAGTIDTLALIDGKFGVLDIKTSAGIYRDYNLQLSAYMDALTRDPLMAGLSTRWILRIDQNQTCKLCGATMRSKGGREKIKKAYRSVGKPFCGSASSPRGGAAGHDWAEMKGIIEIKEFPYWQKDFEAFLGAKKLWEWEQEYWLKKVGYLK